MKRFETRIIEEEQEKLTGKPVKWLLIIEQGDNDSIQIEMGRREVFDLYEASRKAFNEYNEST